VGADKEVVGGPSPGEQEWSHRGFKKWTGQKTSGDLSGKITCFRDGCGEWGLGRQLGAAGVSLPRVRGLGNVVPRDQGHQGGWLGNNCKKNVPGGQKGRSVLVSSQEDLNCGVVALCSGCLRESGTNKTWKLRRFHLHQPVTRVLAGLIGISEWKK